MNDDKNIMKYETVLPVDFDGTFRFTNWTTEEFIGVWGKKEYHFAAESTSPMIMPEYSPLEVQHIRKKFAKDLAEREFFKSAEYDHKFMKQERNPDGTPRLNSIHQAGQYSMDNLTPFIQKCLQPLQLAKVTITEVPQVNMEDNLSRNRKGKINTTAVQDDTDLEKLAKD